MASVQPWGGHQARAIFFLEQANVQDVIVTIIRRRQRGYQVTDWR